jgi:hypothetical protein
MATVTLLTTYLQKANYTPVQCTVATLKLPT